MKFKVGDRVAHDGKTYKVTRVSPGGHRIVTINGRGEAKTMRTFNADDVTKARTA